MDAADFTIFIKSYKKDSHLVIVGIIIKNNLIKTRPILDS